MSFRRMLMLFFLFACVVPIGSAFIADERSYAAEQNEETIAAIKVIQGDLQALSLYSGAIDGIWGEGSDRALQFFRQLAGAKANVTTDELFSLLHSVALIVDALGISAEEALALAPAIQNSALLETKALAAENEGKYAQAGMLWTTIHAQIGSILGETHPLALSAKQEIAAQYRRLNAYRKSEEIDRELLNTRLELLGDEHPDTLATISALAEDLRGQNRFAEAELLERQVLEAFLKLLGNEHPGTLATMSALAEDLRGQNRFAEAELLERQVVETLLKLLGNEHPDTLAGMRRLALTLEDQQKYTEASQLYRNIYDVYRKSLGDNDDNTNISRLQLIKSEMKAGKYYSAGIIYYDLFKSMHVSDSFGPLDLLEPNVLDPISNEFEIIDSMIKVANESEGNGNFVDAEYIFRLALEVYQKSANIANRTQCSIGGVDCSAFSVYLTIKIGEALSNQGRYREAEEQLRKAISLGKSALEASNAWLFDAQNQLAHTVIRQGKCAEAEAISRKALEMRALFLDSESRGTPRTLNILALAIKCQGRISESAQVSQKALDASLRSLGEEHPLTTESMIYMAATLVEQGRFAEAVPLYERALKNAQQALGRTHPVSLAALNGLAKAYAGRGENQLALSTWEKGLEVLPEFFSLGVASSTKQQHELLPLEIDSYLGMVSSASHSPNDADSRGFLAQGWLNFGPLDIVLADLGLRQSAGSDSEVIALRNLQQAREDMQRARQTYLEDVDQSQMEDAKEREALIERISEAQARFEAGRAHLTQTSPNLAALLPQPLTADEAQSALRFGEGLVAYATTDKVLYAWLVTKDDIEWQQISLSKTDLSEKVGRLRQSLDRALPAPTYLANSKCALTSSVDDLEDRPFDRCLARDLHDQLLGAFDLSGLDELIIVPSGPLEQLPFQMLVTAIDDDGTPHWLIEDHAISVLPTTSSLRVLRQSGTASNTDENRSPFLGLAPVEFDGVGGSFNLRSTASTLPSTRDEVTFISALLSGGPDSVVLGEKASEAFVNKASLDRYEVISFATHALLSREARSFTNGAISEPALLLRAGDGHDGFLTATEIASLRLDADWVLLSACNTGAGGSEDAAGLTGLARAFFFAGARSLLVSNWAVDDTAAMELMIQTMQHSAQGGMSRSQALRQAMLNVMNATDRDFRHPFFWAPFSLVGDNG